MNSPGELYGMKVVVERPVQRYKLPSDVPPPTGMTREEFDAWSRRVCGYRQSILQEGQVVCTDAGTMHMTQATWERVKARL